jgi:hypothetical protein
MWILAVIPTDPSGRCKIDHHETTGATGISHSSHLALDDERARGSGTLSLVHNCSAGFETIEPLAPEGAIETYPFE